jgi:glyceraldehyde-3-phosphate dehydrogenase/erythrose-4-phosphate dehydrogenase
MKKNITEAAKAAKLIREELKKAFPGMKFSVTSDNFSMGDAVRISYQDGPKSDKVEAIVKKYQYGNFNGMEDIYEISNSIEGLFQVKFVTISRRASEEVKAQIRQEIESGNSPLSETGYIDTDIHRAFSQRDYSIN